MRLKFKEINMLNDRLKDICYFSISFYNGMNEKQIGKNLLSDKRVNDYFVDEDNLTLKLLTLDYKIVSIDYLTGYIYIG